VINKLLCGFNIKINKLYDKNEKKYWFGILRFTYVITVNKYNNQITEIKRVKDNNFIDKVLNSYDSITNELIKIKNFLEKCRDK
jgi:hypothetical protein